MLLELAFGTCIQLLISLLSLLILSEKLNKNLMHMSIQVCLSSLTNFILLNLRITEYFFNILSFITQQEDNEFFLYINEKSYLGFGDEKIRLFVLGMSQVSKTTSLSYGVTFLCFHCQ